MIPQESSLLNGIMIPQESSLPSLICTQESSLLNGIMIPQESSLLNGIYSAAVMKVETEYPSSSSSAL